MDCGLPDVFPWWGRILILVMLAVSFASDGWTTTTADAVTVDGSSGAGFAFVSTSNKNKNLLLEEEEGGPHHHFLLPCRQQQQHSLSAPGRILGFVRILIFPAQQQE